MRRFILICLLVAAVPLQGFAAAAMAACGAGPSFAAVDVHDARDGATDEAHAMAMEPHDPASPIDRSGRHDGHSVAKCGACCTWTAAPCGLRAFAPTAVVGFVDRYFPAATPAVVPDGLERPPRFA